MKTALLVCRGKIETFEDADGIFCHTGEPGHRDDGQLYEEAFVVAKHHNSDYVIFLRADEDVSASLRPFIERLENEKKNFLFLPHHDPEAGSVWKLRVARKSAMPSALSLFIGQSSDPSYVTGLMANTQAIRVRNCHTSRTSSRGADGPGDLDVLDRAELDDILTSRPDLVMAKLRRLALNYGGAWQLNENLKSLLELLPLLNGDARGHAHVLAAHLYETDSKPGYAYAHHASALLFSKIPEAHFGLARLAHYQGRHQECVTRTIQGINARRDYLDVLPWGREHRLFMPYLSGAKSALEKGNHSLALEWAEEGLKYENDASLKAVRTVCLRKVSAVRSYNPHCDTRELTTVTCSKFMRELETAFLQSSGNEKRTIAIVPVASSAAGATRPTFVLPLEYGVWNRSDINTLRGLEAASGIIALSKCHADAIFECWPFLAPDKVRILPVGFFASLLQRPQDVHLAEGVPWRMAVTAKHQYVIDVANEVAVKVRMLGISIEVVLCQEDASAMGSCHIWFNPVIPSTREDYIGYDVMKAQALGLACIVSEGGSSAENLARGFVIKGDPVGDPFRDAVVKRLVALLAKPDVLREHMIETRKAVETYGWQESLESWQLYFEEVLSS